MIGSSMAPATLTTPAVEVWKDIEGYEGYYEVSNHGQVRSVDRELPIRKNGGRLFYRRLPGKVLKQCYVGCGYLFVNLRGKAALVHRLVAKAFIPNPNNLPFINHKDENKTNNNVDNLEWCDHMYNIHYGTYQARMVKAHSKPIEQLTLEGEHVAFYIGADAAAKAFNGTKVNISQAARGVTHTAYGYRWRYVDK